MKRIQILAILFLFVMNVKDTSQATLGHLLTRFETLLGTSVSCVHVHNDNHVQEYFFHILGLKVFGDTITA